MPAELTPKSCINSACLPPLLSFLFELCTDLKKNRGQRSKMAQGMVLFRHLLSHKRMIIRPVIGDVGKPFRM